MKFELHNDDCLSVMKAMPQGCVDAVVTDPPYGLSFMGRKWDYDVPSVHVWRECLRVLRPGGHLLAFAGTRTQHRMAVNIEDAGFEVRDMIAWIYGSGFPKSHNLKGDWEGWGTALKPALEPITVARKPFKGTVAQNVLEHGTGGINIDACRVGTSKNVPASASVTPNAIYGSGMGSLAAGTAGSGFDPNVGRWPANLIHDGSEEVTQLFPDAGGGKFTVGGTPRKTTGHVCSGSPDRSNAVMNYGDSGSAARFFYTAKASSAERQGTTHPTVKPLDLMAYLCRLVTPPGGVVLDPFMGSGTTIKAAIGEGFDAIGIERDADYFGMAEHRLAEAQLGLPFAA